MSWPAAGPSSTPAPRRRNRCGRKRTLNRSGAAPWCWSTGVFCVHRQPRHVGAVNGQMQQHHPVNVGRINRDCVPALPLKCRANAWAMACTVFCPTRNPVAHENRRSSGCPDTAPPQRRISRRYACSPPPSRLQRQNLSRSASMARQFACTPLAKRALPSTLAQPLPASPWRDISC